MLLAFRSVKPFARWTEKPDKALSGLAALTIRDQRLPFTKHARAVPNVAFCYFLFHLKQSLLSQNEALMNVRIETLAVACICRRGGV